MTPDPASARPSEAPAPYVARATARRVLIIDRLAGLVVRAGGVLVIVAVVGILAFLLGTVWPLFVSAKVTQNPIAGRVPVDGDARMLAMDEYRVLACAVGDAPEVVVFRPDTAEVIDRVAIPGLEGARVSCVRRSIRSHDLVVGTADGRLGFVAVAFTSEYVLGAEGDALRPQMTLGQIKSGAKSVVQRKAGGNLARIRATVDPRGSITLAGGAVRVAGYAEHDGAGAAIAVTADGSVHLVREAAEASDGRFRLEALADGGPAAPADAIAAIVDEEVRTAWTVGRDGAMLRIDLTASPAERRELHLTGRGDGALVVAVETVLGDRSIVLSDDRGRVTVWSLVELPPPASEAEKTRRAADIAAGVVPADGRAVGLLHTFEPFDSPAVFLASCPTKRTMFLGHENGDVTMIYPTNERVLARVAAFHGRIGAIAAAQKDDGVLVAGPGGGYRGFDVDAPHPETNWRALFQRVHYEGYSKPEFQYQSSAGTDEAELKFSLIQLIYGTLKATFYAMLFALPLALLGALYTSQFMHPRVRAYVKPSVEVMASLPSVVLGFIAALVLAPTIESIVPGVFAAILSFGIVGFAAGCVWYVLPPEIRQALGSAARLSIAAVLVAGAGWLCIRLTPSIQQALFSSAGNEAGDFRKWMLLPKGAASGLPLLRLGLFALGVTLGVAILPRVLPLRLHAAVPAVRGLVRGLVYAAAPAVLLAFLAPVVEHLLFGGDFRWFLVGTPDPKHGIIYDQRNSLVVGIAMGFAVIPIIYTIAEDALSSIPDSLRSAALGCGASPWQAATRVILPAAVPGIFSAIMIGLGRAIGETMIVAMATGGTPIMEWTMFNGFRTLSHNIATEMPEAPVDGTHYRVLFLSALVLFALTFVLNTVAEAVRLRFRKKFKGL